MASKILDDPSKEIRLIIDEIQLDLEYKLIPLIIEYMSKLLMKSMDHSLHIPEVISPTIIEFYDLAEFNLLKGTILSENDKQRNLFLSVSYDTYLKIFEKYEDELSFEVCSNFDKIETTLYSTRFYGIRNHLHELLVLKNKNIPYINRRLLRLKYLELKYSNILF